MGRLITEILTCGIAVSIIEGVREWLDHRRKRKDIKDDREALNFKERLELVEKSTAALVNGQKYMLYDRIRYLGHEYISDKEIDFDDRRILNDMHNVYHNELGGNGDLDILMKEVNRLPLKQK